MWRARRLSKRARKSSIGIAVALLLITVCPACYRVNKTPKIEITRVPPSDVGSQDVMDDIKGRVSGAKPSQRLVLFARTRLWWVQPGQNQPFTPIGRDGTWLSKTHLGTEYAALLVESDYRPAPTLYSIPKPGGSVIAVTVIPGDKTKRVVHHKLSFSGFEWTIRVAPSDRGGKNNYDPSNAWTDSQGYLHLRFGGQPNNWTSAQVILGRSLGYGVYRFSIEDLSQLDKAAVLALYTWDPLGADADHREWDLEFSRWGRDTRDNARFILQPFYLEQNVVPFKVPSGVMLYMVDWQPGRLSFRAYRGTTLIANAKPFMQHAFTSRVPTPGKERLRFNLYDYQRGPDLMHKGAEVIIKNFDYHP